MSNRAVKMVQLARMLSERAKAKENVRGFENGRFQGETETPRANKSNQTSTEQCTSNEELNYDLLPNFEPSVLNETQSSINGLYFDVGLLQSKFKLTDNIETDSECDDSLFDKPEWMNNSDDSVIDPDFNLSSTSKSSDSKSENDEEIIALGAQLEEALATPKRKNKKKLRVKLRNSGQSYQSVKGKTVRARSCKAFGNCRSKCNERIDIEKIKLLFKHYWSLGTYDQRILYIGSMINIGDKKCDTLVNATNRKRKREHTMKYTLEVDGNIFNVCKKHFVQCFGKTDSFVKSVINKKIGCPSIPFKNRRGNHTPANKFDVVVEEEVRNHILRFPAYESHYSRRDTCKKYLPASPNLSSMHRLYKSESSNPVSLSKYSQIFKTMGLKFKAPKVDTCSTCDTYVSKIKVAESEDEKCMLIEQKKEHLNNAEMAYEAKRNDKMEAINSNYIKTYAFDLQQCLPTPFLRNSISFYKRQLWTFNLTVHDLESNYAKCFMWHEAMARRRGGNEISSCIFKLLKSLPEETKCITFYSDSCSGQNKNSLVAAMFIAFLSSSEKIDYVDNKFLEPGHTHMECDSDHALIERMKKKTNVQIETLRDWYQFVNTVGSKIETVEMRNGDFYDFSKFSKSKFSFKRVDEDGNRFNWHEVRWLRYAKRSNQVEYKNSLDKNESFKILKVGKRGASVNVQISNVMDLPSISQEKKKDLMSLKQFISPDFHSFYDNLKTNMDEPDTHPDLKEPDNADDV